MQRLNSNWKEGEPLPNAEKTEIDLRKFTEYSMKPDNPQNQGKWMGFAMVIPLKRLKVVK